MLLLKPNCECCDVDLLPESTKARSCSFECTFCSDCAEIRFDSTCPNCGGELLRRPIRPKNHLINNPASTKRFVKAHPECASLQTKLESSL
ncbi:MAG: DUF1272 domain-containing protein [Pseudomonadota bacterium]